MNLCVLFRSTVCVGGFRGVARGGTFGLPLSSSSGIFGGKEGEADTCEPVNGGGTGRRLGAETGGGGGARGS